MIRETPIDVLLVTGMSGAGRSTATRALEDLGWFVVDNLPPAMIQQVLNYVTVGKVSAKVAIVADVRGGTVFDELRSELKSIKSLGHDVRVLFLEADDETIVRRYESSRRPHPLQKDGSILEAVLAERQFTGDLRSSADVVIDTSELNVHELRRRIESVFGDDTRIALRVTVMSFGFKYGIPVDADLVADMRFLPNPFWDQNMRGLTGLDAQVSDYVLAQPDAADFLEKYTEIVQLVEAGYLREGKRYATIAIGCTGGKHRSVAVAQRLATHLGRADVDVRVMHRDLGKE